MTVAKNASSCGSDVILGDSPCINCNYNLRGSSRADVCPECGTPVAESGVGMTLVNANRQWLRRVELGLALILAGAVFTVAATAITMLV